MRGCTPHFLFHLVEKKTGRARSKRKDRFGRNFARVCKVAVRGSAYRCKRRFGLAFGHARVFCEVDTAVPWRMVPRSSGCKDAFDQLLFPRVPLRYALPGALAEAVALALCWSSHRPPASGSEKRRWMYPKLPRAKGFPKDSAFPSLTAARDSQPSPAGGRRSALAQTDPPNIFSFPPGAAHSLFGASKKRMGGASAQPSAWLISPSNGTASPVQLKSFMAF